MSFRSKIGKLPRELRENLNRRLHENAHSGKELAAWLSKESKTTINEQNISDWRSSGFAEWLDDFQKIESIRQMSNLAYRVAKAGNNDNLTEGAIKIAAGKLLPLIELADAEALPEIIGALDKLAKSELGARKDRREKAQLDLARDRESREQKRLELDLKKFERETAGLFLKWFDDETTKAIATGKADTETKIGELIQVWFGDMPEGIGPK